MNEVQNLLDAFAAVCADPKAQLKAALADESINSSVSPLVNYKTDHDESIVENDVDNAFTIKALYRLGFHWHITDMDYIDSVILMLKTVGFFEY